MRGLIDPDLFSLADKYSCGSRLHVRHQLPLPRPDIFRCARHIPRSHLSSSRCESSALSFSGFDPSTKDLRSSGHRLVRNADVPRRTMRPGDAPGYLAVVQGRSARFARFSKRSLCPALRTNSLTAWNSTALPEPPPRKRARHLFDAPLLLRLLFHPVASALDPHLEAQVSFRRQGKLAPLA